MTIDLKLDDQTMQLLTQTVQDAKEYD